MARQPLTNRHFFLHLLIYTMSQENCGSTLRTKVPAIKLALTAPVSQAASILLQLANKGLKQ